MKEKSIFKNFNFMTLWAGQSVSQLGSRLYSLAIMWYILDRTGSSLAMGVSVLCFTLPTVLIGPIAGVFADKFSKKNIIVTTDFINGLLMLILSYLISLDTTPLLAIYLMMALAASVSAVFTPAMGSSFPLIVEEKNLTKANSLTQMSSRIISIVGPALAGLLIGVLNMWILFLANGISYLISSLTESFITIPKVNNTKDKKEKFRTQFKEGLKVVFSNKNILYLVISGGLIINFFLAPLSIYGAIISDNLDKGAFGMGLIQSSVSIGALLGSLLVLLSIVKNKVKMTIFGLTLEGVALIGYGMFINNYYLILISQLALGFGVAFASVGISTLYQTIIPKDKQGRVFSIVGTLLSVSVPLGALFGSMLINNFELNNILIISGIIVSIAGLSLIGITDKKENKEDVLVTV